MPDRAEQDSRRTFGASAARTGRAPSTPLIRGLAAVNQRQQTVAIEHVGAAALDAKQPPQRALTIWTIVPALASASVDRYQTRDATFTTTQPAGEYGQFHNVWTHNYNVTINPCDNTFSGTGVETGQDQNGVQRFTETVKGTFNADGTTSLVNTRDDGVVWSLTSAPTDGSITHAQLIAPAISSNLEFKVTAPVNTGTSNYKNHGDYVSQMGGGDDAAHSCIGMPIH